jgi:dTDP-4-dehydrorhamnose 3,5-epimerase
VQPTFTPHAVIPQILIVEPLIRSDSRGTFIEAYKASDYDAVGITARFVQDNQSVSTRWVLRGLHFQLPPRAQAKLVRCIEGEVFDVAVDLRPDAPTYRRYASVTLKAEEQRLIWIPVGFAHGFLTLSERATVVYQQTNEYSPNHEGLVRWDDPSLNIKWPLGRTVPLLSDKDARAPFLSELDPPRW